MENLRDIIKENLWNYKKHKEYNVYIVSKFYETKEGSEVCDITYAYEGCGLELGITVVQVYLSTKGNYINTKFGRCYLEDFVS